MIERGINIALENYRMDWKWGYGEMAFKLDENMTADQYKRYILEDRLTGDMVAKACRLMVKPYAPASEILSGEIGGKLKAMLFDAGLTARMAILRVFPTLKKSAVKKYVNGLYQALADNSRAPIWVCIVYQACRKPCISYEYILNKDEMAEIEADMVQDEKQMVLLK